MKFDLLLASIENVLQCNPLSSESQHLEYGTSGYRCTASLLKGIAIRIGIFACLRSLSKNGLSIGIMITASHNPGEDNGIKIIDSDGFILPTEAEESVIEFVRCSSGMVRVWTEKFFPQITDFDLTPSVYLGWDTRVSSAALADEIKAGVRAVGGRCEDFGLVTTPQLHLNVQLQGEIQYTQKYAKRFASCFSSLEGFPINVNVDCAHGVGSFAITSLANCLHNEFSKSSYPVNSPRLCIKPFNTLTEEKDLLNRSCGADYVKLCSKPPTLTPIEKNAFSSEQRWATIDGDADRLLYFLPLPAVDSHSNEPRIALIDGDRIACLFAAFIKSQFDSFVSEPKLSLGVVQTAYANSASTQYLKNDLSIRVACSLTGVKHLHNLAKEFDFGVYFEANGHGTVLLSKAARDFVSSLPCYHRLRGFASLVNTSVGDAIADLLLVEYVLAVRRMNLQSWLACYTEFPSRQLKVAVADKSIFKLVDVDRRVAQPENLQIEIDNLVSEVDRKVGNRSSTRAFIRPSGTEDIVRVYAESASQQLADWLANSVACIVYNLANGVGGPPTPAGSIPL